MKTHLNILEDVLAENGNDIAIAKEILSYLYPCKQCKNYCIDVKVYYVEDVTTFNDDFEIKILCFNCMKEIMLNHKHGKNGVFTVFEMEKYIHKYSHFCELI